MIAAPRRMRLDTLVVGSGVLSALATLLMLGLLWRSWRGEAPVSSGGHA